MTVERDSGASASDLLKNKANKHKKKGKEGEVTQMFSRFGQEFFELVFCN